MRAVSGKSPAVMQRPERADAAFSQKAEQHRQIDIAVMQIVQMNDIRLNPLQLPNKHRGRGGLLRKRSPPRVIPLFV